MKKSSAIATFFLVLSAGAAGAGAVSMNGSDTMADLTKCVLLACPVGSPGTLDIQYIGGGSGTGESAMRNGTNNQQIAPMSSNLSDAAICDNSVHGSSGVQAESLHVALDGVSIIAPDSQDGSCDTLAKTSTITVNTGLGSGACPGCSGTSYTFTDWKDLLRVVWSGRHHDASATTDCNSAVRNTIVQNYGMLFQTPSSCTGQTCTSIRHVWRRDDLSGTQDTWRGLLGLPAIAATPGAYCNGTDTQDKDPIRITCDPLDTTHLTPAEQVCRFDHTLGLVLPVTQPETAPDAVKYNATACARGVFDFAPLPTRDASTCPDGQPSAFGKCLFPQDSSGHFGCLNTVARNLPLGAAPSGDPRGWNFILRNNDGTIVKDTNNREMSGAWYRIHTTNQFAGTSCTQSSSTKQIGCFAQASPCSIGYAGLEAGTAIAGVSPVKVNSVGPSVPAVRGLLSDPSATLDTTYKLARFLRINTLLGFSNVSVADQKSLAHCFNDQSVVFPCTNSVGFITLADTVAAFPNSQCEDYNEQAKCGAASNNDACASNATF